MSDHRQEVGRSALAPGHAAGPVTVTLPDGSRRDFADPVTGAELAAAIGPGLAKAAVAVKIDGRPRDLATLIDHDAAAASITRDMPEGVEILRHDAAHVIVDAVKVLYAETQVRFGSATEFWVYYDFARAIQVRCDYLRRCEWCLCGIVRRV